MAAPSTVFIKDWRKYNKKAVPNETAGPVAMTIVKSERCGKFTTGLEPCHLLLSDRAKWLKETAGCVFINYLNHCKNKKSA
jgi:hypothetical protein